MAVEALGRHFNYRHVAANSYIRLDTASQIAFLCYLATTVDTYTLTEAKDAAGTGAQVLAKITRFHTNKGDGTDVWVLTTQAAGSTFAKTAVAAQSAACLEVAGAQLSDKYKYVKLAAAGASVITAVQFDLVVQRAPANLPAVGV